MPCMQKVKKEKFQEISKECSSDLKECGASKSMSIFSSISKIPGMLIQC